MSLNNGLVKKKKNHTEKERIFRWENSVIRCNFPPKPSIFRVLSFHLLLAPRRKQRQHTCWAFSGPLSTLNLILELRFILLKTWGFSFWSLLSVFLLELLDVDKEWENTDPDFLASVLDLFLSFLVPWAVSSMSSSGNTFWEDFVPKLKNGHCFPFLVSIWLSHEEVITTVTMLYAQTWEAF